MLGAVAPVTAFPDANFLRIFPISLSTTVTSSSLFLQLRILEMNTCEGTTQQLATGVSHSYLSELSERGPADWQRCTGRTALLSNWASLATGRAIGAVFVSLRTCSPRIFSSFAMVAAFAQICARRWADSVRCTQPGL